MIIKAFEKDKLKKTALDLFLVYGENEGQKKELIPDILNNFESVIDKYDEKDVLDNQHEIISSLLNKSFFEEKKTIIILRSSDKLLSFVEEIIEKRLTDTKIILLSDRLDKKSSIRNFFEKSKMAVCIPVYSDDHRTLSKIAIDNFREKQISISQECINIIVEKCSGDRNNLKKELDKIMSYLDKSKKISSEEVYKIVNLSENYEVSELVDNCLCKNLKQTIKILNDNNYSGEDCILIIRTLIQKTKRLRNVLNEYEKTQNLEQVISEYRPPIFWKDKNAVKRQAKVWDLSKIDQLAFKTNDIEMLIKKNTSRSLNILYDFIIDTSKNNV